MKNKNPSSVVRLSLLLILFTFFTLSMLSLSIPDNAFITRSQTNGKWLPEGSRWALSAKEESANPVWQSNSEEIKNSQIKKLDATVYFCGIIPIKKVDISVTDELKVIPGGDILGINLKTKGVLVAGTENITDGEKNYSPAKNAGLKSGDIIISINGANVHTTDDVQKAIDSSSGHLTVRLQRQGKEFVCEIKCVYDGNSKKIGLWVRDTVAGIGTATFYYDNSFAALGHPISDIDTGKYVESDGGSIFKAKIAGIDKGEKGIPGALKGVFSGEKTGEIEKNSSVGIYGKCAPPNYEAVSIASRSEVKAAPASIICDIGQGRESFSVNIVQILPKGDSSKGMVIEITDKKLIEECGGIVQGMSGSPLIQNGKLIGAVTHVFVNDPTRGYGIFIENMLAEAEKIR